MNFQTELRKSKQTIRDWVRTQFSNQRLTSVIAFNADGNMSFGNPCNCLMGVTSSDRFHVGQQCDREHYWVARRQDIQPQNRRFTSLFSLPEMGIAEKAYKFLGSPATSSGSGDEAIRRRRFSALLRAERRRRERLNLFAQDLELRFAPLLSSNPGQVDDCLAHQPVGLP